MSPEELAQFKEWGVPLPTRDAHVKDEDIVQNMQTPHLENWRLEGNILKATSQLGEHGWIIPTDYILDGTDDKGLPILRKLAI